MKEKMKLAVMFSDISSSTNLYSKIGNEQAFDIISRCMSLMVTIIQNHHGQIIKTIGDEVMSIFTTADYAAEAALEMQHIISNLDNFGTKLTIRIGFHFGEVIQEDGDVFGKTVILASRITAYAKAEQILTTADTVALLNPSLKEQTRFLMVNQVKGMLKAIEIYEFTQGTTQEQTVMLGSLKTSNAKKTILKLYYSGTMLHVSQEQPLLTIGRGNKNHLNITNNMASRIQHAFIELRQGRFVLTDKSANGTYIISNQGERNFIHHEEFNLTGAGMLGFGKDILTNNDPDAVRFLITIC